MVPGNSLKITFNDETIESIKIGATGSYYIDTGIGIKKVELE
jgi:hypothetical protein